MTRHVRLGALETLYHVMILVSYRSSVFKEDQDRSDIFLRTSKVAKESVTRIQSVVLQVISYLEKMEDDDWILGSRGFFT
jgi:hypothetical protein